jgi:hypothetical protein
MQAKLLEPLPAMDYSVYTASGRGPAVGRPCGHWAPPYLDRIGCRFCCWLLDAPSFILAASFSGYLRRGWRLWETGPIGEAPCPAPLAGL